MAQVLNEKPRFPAEEFKKPTKLHGRKSPSIAFDIFVKITF